MIIEQLILPAQDPQALSRFYTEVLDLDFAADDLEVRATIGESVLAFRRSDEPIGCHFAFNVPWDRFEEAKTWLSGRTKLVASPDGQETFESVTWNSRGIYFRDPEENIGELIARRNLQTDRDDLLLGVSEAGIPTSDVPALQKRLCEELGVLPYKDGSDDFRPIGDEEGLLILVRNGRPWFPDLIQPAVACPIAVIVRGATGSMPVAFDRSSSYAAGWPD